MELLQLKYFCDAAETENFSKTAAKYNVPTSNISQMIHKLEKELNRPLFDRNANRVFLNADGASFYRHIKAGLDNIEDAKIALADERLYGTRELSLQVHTNRQIVTAAVGRFKSLYPETILKITYGIDTENFYDITFSDDVPVEKGIKKQHLITEDILLAIEKGNPLASHDEIDIKELKNESFIAMHSDSSLYKFLTGICGAAGFVPDIAIQCDDPFYVRKYVEMGMGITFMPSFSWKNLFHENVTLKKVGDFKRYTYAYWNEERYVKKSAVLFLNILKDMLAEWHLS